MVSYISCLTTIETSEPAQIPEDLAEMRRSRRIYERWTPAIALELTCLKMLKQIFK